MLGITLKINLDKMKLLFPALIVAFLILNTSIPVFADSIDLNFKDSLQTDVNSLKIGISTIDDIEKLFGKPERLRKGVEWHAVVYNNIRTMYHADYISKGLTFTLFDNPSQLYSISITKHDISNSGVRLGDSEQSVREKLDEVGSWMTTDTQDWWWLVFKNKGLRVGFERDVSQKKYPINLAIPVVATRIEVYDPKIKF